MKKILLSLLLIVALQQTFAQGGALADLKFEEVETAFNKSDYNTVLAKLNEFDKLYGSVTSKSLYLRIVAQEKLLNSWEAQPELLTSLDKNAQAYLKAMEKDGLDDKYREVYAISQRVNDALKEKGWKEMPEFKQGVTAENAGLYSDALTWFKKAAEKGNPAAMSNIGLYYYRGAGVEQNYTEALNWYKKAADSGYVDAMVDMGILYFYGRGVVQSHTEAFNWYKKAADKGNARGIRNVGRHYQTGDGVAQNYPEAMTWYKKAADKGYAIAMNDIGVLYAGGYGVTKNDAEAFNWYKKAAENGNEYAMGNLGDIYGAGRGVTQNYTEALKWYKKAAEIGNVRSMINIGGMYYAGTGVTIDYTEALNWYKKAFNQGTDEQKTTAKAGIAKCYYRKGQTSFDKKEYTVALENFKNAFKFGLEQAAKNQIVEIYRKGLGVPKNKDLAKEWENK